MYLSPKYIVEEFLRKNVTDPRGRITSNSDSFTASASQTEFQLTPSSGKKLSHIESVTVDGTPQSKWGDYYINSKSQKVIFFNGLTGSESVIINYGETSSNWIFTDKPKEKLTALKYPRMNILIVGNPGTRLGNYETPVQGTIRFQVDIWTKESADNQIFTIEDLKYTGDNLAEYLSYLVTSAFENNESELFPALYDYDPVGMPPDLPFDDELQSYHYVVEFILKGVNLGRIS